MSKRRKSSSCEMVSKNKYNVISCSTPEPRIESPSRDSDSLYDSDAASPVPFICTQDGTEGETDVVWNFYTPKSDTTHTKYKNSTPLSRRGRKPSIRPKLLEVPLPKRKPIKSLPKNTELFQELTELKQNLQQYINKKSPNAKPQSDEDIFSDTSDNSPKSGLRSSSRCLRKNVLSSKFNQIEPENGLESDDSMNECLIKASQVVEEKVLAIKRTHTKIKTEDDSMDAILSNIKFDTPTISKVKKYSSPRFNDDSFDNLLENLNDSTLDKLTQMPIDSSKRTPLNIKMGSSLFLKEAVVHDGSPTNLFFGRHNSMPESPSASNIDAPSTSGKTFGRYSSMPFDKSDEKHDSPIKCTPDEIKKKRQQAREKLLAKRTLPFTSTQNNNQLRISEQNKPEKPKNKFQHKILRTRNFSSNIQPEVRIEETKNNNSESDIRMIIEKKRQEALMKLRKRQQK